MQARRYFLDTNIFVYTFDDRAPLKKRKAIALVEQALDQAVGVVSYQVVQEFFNVALRKFEVPLSHSAADAYLREVFEPICTVFGSLQMYRRGLQIHERWRLHFYDALIVAGAIEAGCDLLYSEDLQHGQRIETTEIVNPFLDKLLEGSP